MTDDALSVTGTDDRNDLFARRSLDLLGEIGITLIDQDPFDDREFLADILQRGLQRIRLL